MTVEPTRLGHAFASFEELWSPRVAASLNDHVVKLARADGEFVWHHHEETDELFLVVSGRLRIEFRDQPAVTLSAGDLVVVPRGIEHRPVAEEETELLLVEAADTLNTGNVEHELTAADAELE